MAVAPASDFQACSLVSPLVRLVAAFFFDFPFFSSASMAGLRTPRMRLDFPDPEMPAITVSRPIGRRTSMFFRLLARAPRTWTVSWLSETEPWEARHTFGPSNRKPGGHEPSHMSRTTTPPLVVVGGWRVRGGDRTPGHLEPRGTCQCAVLVGGPHVPSFQVGRPSGSPLSVSKFRWK